MKGLLDIPVQRKSNYYLFHSIFAQLMKKKNLMATLFKYLQTYIGFTIIEYLL